MPLHFASANLVDQQQIIPTKDSIRQKATACLSDSRSHRIDLESWLADFLSIFEPPLVPFDG